METQHAEAACCKSPCSFGYLPVETRAHQHVVLDLIDHVLVLFRPMLTVVTVGMGARAVSQVSYHFYSSTEALFTIANVLLPARKSVNQ